MIITCEAQTFLPHQPYGLGCATMSGTIVTSSRNGEVQVYSPSLQLVSSFELKDKVDKIRISPAGDYVGVCLRNRVLVLTVDGKTVKSIPQQDWDTYATGDCSFFPDNRFWMIHPIASDKFQIDVFDTKSWNVVASDHFCLDEQCVFRFIPHPEGRLVAVWAGAGQDGAWLTFTKFQNDHIKVLQEPQIWTFPPVFHPGGGEFLEINDGELSRYSFPEVNLLGNQLLQSQTFGEQDGFDGFVQYVADDKAILAIT